VIKKYVGGKFLGLNFFPEVSYRYKKNNMWYKFGQIVVQQIVKCLVIVIYFRMSIKEVHIAW
jgi:hypothetical protein